LCEAIVHRPVEAAKKARLRVGKAAMNKTRSTAVAMVVCVERGRWAVSK
jgi:hypothetical protein